MSVAITNKINKKFLKSLKRPEEKPAPLVTIDELAEHCRKAFPLYANPIKEYLLEQDRLDALEK